MLGLTDFWIGLAYIGIIASVITCVVYGVTHWNKGELDSVEAEETIKWGREEEEIDKEFE